MEPRAESGIFIGYSNETKGYKVMKDGWAKMFYIQAPRDCTFKEDSFPQIMEEITPTDEAERSEIIDVPTFWARSEQCPFSEKGVTI